MSMHFDHKAAEEAVRNGMPIEELPLESLDESVCLASVSRRGEGWTLFHVPEHMRTPEVCMAAAKNGDPGRSASGAPTALESVPDAFRTPELCYEACKADGWALCHVPQGSMSEAVCHAAVCSDGLVLQHVPFKYQTKAVCEAAVRQNADAMEWVPASLAEEVAQAAGAAPVPGR